jgi:hypothetical protein
VTTPLGEKHARDAADMARWAAQTAPDPRAHKGKYRPRLALYEDDFPTRAERGTRQTRFIDPYGK